MLTGILQVAKEISRRADLIHIHTFPTVQERGRNTIRQARFLHSQDPW